jgi:hypothetical protein
MESPRQAVIRRLYSYLVAVIGLAAVAVGIGGTVATLLDLVLQPLAAHPAAWWQDKIALFATLAAVGLPVWLGSWLPIQQEATDPRAQRSLVRRMYLFVVFGATVLTLLISGVYALYQVVRLTLGEAWTSGQTTDTLSALSALLVAGLLLAYHFSLLQTGSGAPEAQPAALYTARIFARSADTAQLDASCRDLLTHAPVGVELQIQNIAPGDEPAERVGGLDPESGALDVPPIRVA